MKVAVLALQGAFIEHEQILRRMGVETIEIRQLSDWESYLGSSLIHTQGKMREVSLILPGGESTVQMRLLTQLGLLAPIRTAIHSGLPVMGTCAGMILLSKGYLGTMDIRVLRNAYGRQLGSFHTEGLVQGVGENIPMTFIRAPYIEEVISPQCQVLSEVDGHIVAARQGNQLALSFHPELDHDLRLHQYFLEMVK